MTMMSNDNTKDIAWVQARHLMAAFRSTQDSLAQAESQIRITRATLATVSVQIDNIINSMADNNNNNNNVRDGVDDGFE